MKVGSGGTLAVGVLLPGGGNRLPGPSCSARTEERRRRVGFWSCMSSRQEKRAEARQVGKALVRAVKSGGLVLNPGMAQEVLPQTNAPKSLEQIAAATSNASPGIAPGPQGKSQFPIVPMRMAKRKKKKNTDLWSLVSGLLGSVPSAIGSLATGLLSKAPAAHRVAATNPAASRLTMGSSDSIGVAFPAENPEQALQQLTQTRVTAHGLEQQCTGSDYVVSFDPLRAYDAGDVIFSVTFNPRAFPNTSLFTESTRFKRWIVPRSGDFIMWFNSSSPTTSTGQMIGYWETDVDADELQGDAQLRRAFSAAGEAPTQLWESMGWPWPGATDKDFTTLYTDPGVTSDLKWAAPGKFVLVAATAIAAGALQGTLHIMYNMTFRLHEYDPQYAGQSSAFSAVNSSTNPVGSGNVKAFNDSVGFDLNNNQVITGAPNQGVVYIGVPDTFTAADLAAGLGRSTLPVGTTLFIHVQISGSIPTAPTLTAQDMTLLPQPTAAGNPNPGVPPGDGQTVIPRDANFNATFGGPYIIQGPRPRIIVTSNQLATGGFWMVAIVMAQSQAGHNIAQFYMVPSVSATPPPQAVAGTDESEAPFRQKTLQMQRQTAVKAEVSKILANLAIETYTEVGSKNEVPSLTRRVFGL